jgi:hypothetical protein
MLFLTSISTVTSTSVFSGTATFGGTSTPSIQSAGVSATDLLLWALLSSALFGALGGVYQGSAAKSWGKYFFAILTFILELLAKPLYLLLATLSQQSASSLHTSTRSLLYSAFSCTLLLAIATAVVGSLLIADNQTLTLLENQHLRDLVSVLLVTVPGLLLFCACATALCRDPVEEGSTISPEKRR